MGEKVVAIIGTLDTKGAEYAYLKQQIESQGVATLVIDVGVFGQPPFAPDIAAAEVARAGGADLAALAAAGDRGKAVAAMSAGAAVVLKRLTTKAGSTAPSRWAAAAARRSARSRCRRCRSACPN